MQEQVQRKVLHASKALIKVGKNDEEIKIFPNSGNFKVLAEEVIKLKVGDEINTKEALATVKDQYQQYQQTDIKGTPYMIKTEFHVLDVANGSSNKAVMHTFFMIQGKGIMSNKSFCKDFFFENVIKKFMKYIMKNKGKEINFLNQLLKAQTRTVKTVNLGQWKRKQKEKYEKCDVCSRTFPTKQGMKIHQKKMHKDIQVKQKTAPSITSIKLNDGLSRSDSVHSVSGGSRPSSPSPKKFIVEKAQGKQVGQEKKTIIEMEQSGGSGDGRYRANDDQISFGVQFCINEPDREERMRELEEDLRLAKEEIVGLKTEKSELKSHNDRKHKGYESEYEELLKEASATKEELNKIQSEKDILLAKVISLENYKSEREVDECVIDVACEGNCEHGGCSMAQLQRLNNKKNHKLSPM